MILKLFQQPLDKDNMIFIFNCLWDISVLDRCKLIIPSVMAAHPWLHDEQQQVPLDILMYKLVKLYLRASPFKRAALKVWLYFSIIQLVWLQEILSPDFPYSMAFILCAICSTFTSYTKQIYWYSYLCEGFECECCVSHHMKLG